MPGKRPTDNIADHIVQTPALGATFMDLMHMPSPVLAWLMTRPEAQQHAVASIAKHAQGQSFSGGLLKHDQNVLVLTTSDGTKLYVYPDGGVGSAGQPVSKTPEGLGQALGALGSDIPGVVDPNMTNLVVMPDVEDPLGGIQDELGLDGDLMAISGDDDIIEEPILGKELGASEIDSWIDSLDKQLKPEESGQAQEQVGFFDSEGHPSPIHTERRKKR